MNDEDLIEAAQAWLAKQPEGLERRPLDRERELAAFARRVLRSTHACGRWLPSSGAFRNDVRPDTIEVPRRR